MPRIQSSSRTLAGLALGCAAAVAGCGGSDYKNADRPATPINVTAALSSKKISVEPKSFGAGPIVVIISNQTSTVQTLNLDPVQIGSSNENLKASAGPIQPRGTSELKLDAKKGTYKLSTRAGGLAPVTLKVGPPRKSAQDSLLEP